MKTKFLSIISLFLLLMFLSACAVKTHEISPLRVEIRTQAEDFLIQRVFPPEKIFTNNGEIVSFFLVVKDNKTGSLASGVLVESNLVDAVDKISKTDEDGIVVFSEPIGVADGVSDTTKISQYGKISRERTVYPRFWVIYEKK
ncbi:hypothetical protein KKG48_02070 [Patescibacteria group bacterium]|nr:hypothetical protein [Patescibacteria group bacterium]